MKSESLEPVSQVTQLDLRDNCLDSLDLSSICNLETLHVQRNQLGTLALSGFTLRMLHASSNRESNTVAAAVVARLSVCLCVQALLPCDEHTHTNGPDVSLLISAFICPQALQQSTSIPSLTN